MLCDICKTAFRCINGEFICQEGHVSATKVEIADDVHFTFKCKKTKTVKEDCNVFNTFSLEYRKLLLYKLLFTECIDFLKCKNTKYFSYFTNFYDGDRNEVEVNVPIKFGMLGFLLYITKREEIEEKGDIIFYASFSEEMKKFPLDAKIKHFKEVLGLKKVDNTYLGLTKNHLFLCRKMKYLDILGKANYPVNLEYNQIYKETSFSHPLIEYNKLLIRQNLICDLKLMFKYFQAVIKILSIKKTHEMIFYFEKYVYMRGFHKIICIPEEEVCYFLFLYDRHKKVEINYEESFKNVNILIGNTKYDDTVKYDYDKYTIRNPITLFLRTTDVAFLNDVNALLRDDKFRGKSKFLYGVYSHQNLTIQKNLTSLKMYVKRLKEFLSKKLNYTKKRKYVEDDRI